VKIRFVLTARTDPADPSTEAYATWDIDPAEMSCPLERMGDLYLRPAFVAIRERLKTRDIAAPK
jgi:hypothetical protein